MNKEFEKWLEDKPEIIKELAGKYPPGKYVIKEGAPYGISCPGTTVQIHSYSEQGTIAVVVLPEDKRPEAILHEKILGKRFQKTKEELEAIHDNPALVDIDPIYLKPIN